MAQIEHGDILLSNGSIFGENGDLASGDAREQHIGAIVNANAGNFRAWPTLGANLSERLNGPLDSRNIVASLQNALFLDGWSLGNLEISETSGSVTITIVDAEKTTDDTKSLS